MATARFAFVPIFCAGVFLALAFGFMAIDLFWVLPECERRCESRGGLDEAWPEGWGTTRYRCEDGETHTVHNVEWVTETTRRILEGSDG